MLKRLLILAMFLMLPLTLAACGGGGGDSGGVATNPDAPKLSGFSYSPSSASLNQGGGEVTVSVALTVEDIQDDVKKLIVNVFDDNNRVVANYTVTGHLLGPIHFDLPAQTMVRGTFHFEIYAEDAQSHISNKVSGTFTVT